MDMICGTCKNKNMKIEFGESRHIDDSIFYIEVFCSNCNSKLIAGSKVILKNAKAMLHDIQIGEANFSTKVVLFKGKYKLKVKGQPLIQSDVS